MADEMLLNSAEFLNRQKKKKIWIRVVIALACIVVFCTTYALILPALTMTGKTYCGAEEHKHSDSCYTAEIICTESHEHTDSCYKKTLVCDKEEHIHTTICYSDPEADVESKEIWEKTLPDNLMGNSKSDLAAVAESQLGYNESVKNYAVDKDGAVKGYTRYGDWYGDKYGDWNAMFVSFCLNYAGIPESKAPYSSSSADMAEQFKWKNIYKSSNDYSPEIGDIAFIDTDNNNKADIAGIVTDVSADKIKVIEGDFENKVERKSYNLGEISGYGVIPEQKKVAAFAPAPKAVTVNNEADFINAVNNGSDIILGADFTLNPVTITSGKNIILDLNGHNLNAAGANALFTIQNNAIFTVIDSKVPDETVTDDAGNKYGHTAEAVKNGNSVTLNFYVTESRIVNDETGATVETVKKHTVTGSGVINGNNRPVFSVMGGATLNIESGMIYGGTNRAVNMTGGTVNMSGGYICGFNKTGAINTADQNFGGAVLATGGALNISGAVLAGNEALNGGAVYAKGNAVINMTDGIISGNKSTRNSTNWGDHSEGAPYRCGGGGFFTSGDNKITLDGGFITNNMAADDDYFDGGGGVLISGTTEFTMNAGYITGNEAAGGGGVRTDWGKKAVFNMNGGFISSNVARSAEGGGVAVTQQGVGNFGGGYVTNNKIVRTPHWGGGGIFCSDGSTINLKSALITENKAGGFGGGVAGCPTGKIYLYIDEGCAIFDNSVNLYPDSPHLSGDGSAKGKDHEVCDDFFRNHGNKDYFCALHSTVTGEMLGGGSADWEGSADGKAVNADVNDIIEADNVMGLSSNPSKEAKQSAKDSAKFYINGNESYTHGGGILCNGDLIVGNPTDIEVPSNIELKGTKALLGSNGDRLPLEGHEFKFIVTDESGKTVSTGTSDANGNITFTPSLTFNKDGEYIFYIRESVENKEPGVQYDTTEYRLTVNVKRDNGVPLYGETVKYTYRITSVKLEKRNGDEAWQLISENNNTQSGTITVPLSKGASFTNSKPNSINMTVTKKWPFGAGAPSVTVDLYRNGVVVDTQILNEANNWTYTWADLPATDDDGNPYTYEVRERPVPGYVGDYTTASGGSGETASYWVPADSIEAGEQYMMVNTAGDYALMIASGNERNNFDANDKIAVAQETGSLTLNGKTYSTWYSADSISDRSIFTAEAIQKNGNNCIVFKNNGTDQSCYVYIQYEGQMKGGSTTTYTSAFSLDGDVLKGQFGNNWNPGNLRTVAFENGKFGVNQTGDNAVKLYKLVTGATSVGGGEITVITNTPIDKVDFTVKLLKVSKDDPSKTLSGAVFSILDENGTPRYFTGSNGVYALADKDTPGATTELANGADGRLEATGLPAGKYILREVKAPDGYGLIDDIKFTLDENTPSAIYEMTIEEPDKGFELPETGGTGTFIFTVSGALFIASGLIYGYGLMRRRERRRRE